MANYSRMGKGLYVQSILELVLVRVAGEWFQIVCTRSGSSVLALCWPSTICPPVRHVLQIWGGVKMSECCCRFFLFFFLKQTSSMQSHPHFNASPRRPTCDDVLQDAVFPFANLRFHLPLLQLSYQVHLWHLRHHWALESHVFLLNAA